MTFDIDAVVESKRAYRRRLADLPVAQKLAMLDALRDRTLTVRKAAILSQPATVQKSAPGQDMNAGQTQHD